MKHWNAATITAFAIALAFLTWVAMRGPQAGPGGYWHTEGGE